MLERDIYKISKSYLGGVFLIDLMANVPIICYMIFFGLPRKSKEIELAKHITLYRACMGLKSLRLAHIGNVFNGAKRLTDTLGETFTDYIYTFENLLKWTKAAYKLVMSTHYFACGWVMIQLHAGDRS